MRSSLDAGGRPRTLPARPAAHPGRWRPGRVGAVRRGGMVACATASLIYACRDRRSVFRRAGPRTDIGRWVAQGVRGDRPCHGVRPGAPPGSRGRDGHRVSWSSRPIRTRRARGRSRSPPPRGSSRAGSAWRRWRAAAAAPSTSGPASPPRTRPAGAAVWPRSRAGAGTPRPPRSARRGPARPALVIAPRRVRAPLEYSEGVRPVNPMNAGAEANRRKSATSAARVSAVSSAIPR